ncbi:MAG TPA: hypothetical protein VMH41_02235 [Mycobacteriales bacterium]|nr:hypothetical protein [Mycobacteriales bacterium]
MTNPARMACAALVLFAAAACHSSGGGTGTAATPAATDTANAEVAKAQITQNWQAFFASDTTAKTAIGLLQDGAQLTKAVNTMIRIDRQAGLSRTAIVNTITFTGPATAAVYWDQDNGATKLLDNVKGKAVVQGDQWVVSKKTFCEVVTAANDQVPPTGCHGLVPAPESPSPSPTESS